MNQALTKMLIYIFCYIVMRYWLNTIIAPDFFYLFQTGRVDFLANRVIGHSGPVLDIKWNPFNDNIVASCSEDCTVSLFVQPRTPFQPTNFPHSNPLHFHVLVMKQQQKKRNTKLQNQNLKPKIKSKYIKSRKEQVLAGQ